MKLMALCIFLGNALASDLVRNGEHPASPAQTFHFERELRIGPESGDDHFVWTGASVMVATNKNGHMYVMDRGSLRIIELDEQGHFVRQIGKQGEGPGEFVRLTNICVLDDQRLVATESRRGATILNFFDPQGNFIKRIDAIPNGINFTSSKYAPNGRFISATYYQLKKDATGTQMGYGILDEQGNLLLDLGQHAMPIADRNRLTDSSFWAEYMSAWFALQPVQGIISFAADGQVFTAVANQYSVTRYSADLKNKFTFVKKARPRIQSAEEQAIMVDPMHQRVLANLPGSLHAYVTEATVRKALSLANLSEMQPPILGLVPTEDGGVLVVTNYDPKAGKADGDIFDSQGVFQGTCALPDPEIDPFGSYNNLNVKMWFRNGKVYTIEDVEGEYVLNRYSYRKHAR